MGSSDGLLTYNDGGGVWVMSGSGGGWGQCKSERYMVKGIKI